MSAPSSSPPTPTATALDKLPILIEIADRVGITLANLSVLKDGHARAITLTALCEALDCQPGDLFTVVRREAADPAAA